MSISTYSFKLKRRLPILPDGRTSRRAYKGAKASWPQLLATLEQLLAQID
jgi:hypothetical protein